MALVEIDQKGWIQAVSDKVESGSGEGTCFRYVMSSICLSC